MIFKQTFLFWKHYWRSGTVEHQYVEYRFALEKRNENLFFILFEYNKVIYFAKKKFWKGFLIGVFDAKTKDAFKEVWS